MTNLHLSILGSVTLTCTATGNSVALSRSSQELAGCLALNASRQPLRREVLAEMLWPEASPDCQKSRLRSALWRLRKSIGTEFSQLFVIQSEFVQLAASSLTELPHLQFEDRVTHLCAQPLSDMTDKDFSSLDKVLRQYRGPLLDGMDADWIDPERERFAELYGQGLERQIRYHQAMGRDHETIRASRQLLQIDPYREDVHALLISLFGQNGRPQKAKQQFDNCRELMEQDLGLTPTAAQQSLNGALQQDRPAQDISGLLGQLERSMKELSGQIATLKSALAAIPGE